MKIFDFLIQTPGRFRAGVKIVIQDLQQTSPKLPSWLHVSQDSIPAIIEVLQLWDAGINTKTTEVMLENHQEDPMHDVTAANELLPDSVSIPMGLDPRIVDIKMLAAMTYMVQRMSDEEVIQKLGARIGARIGRCPGSNRPHERQNWLKEARELMVRALMMQYEHNCGSTDTAPIEFKQQSEWYKNIGVFVPPIILCKRHPGFDEIWKGFKDTGRASCPKSLLTKVLFLVC